MGLWLFLIFVVLPLVEIALFVKVGGLIGVMPTILLVILAAVSGMAIIRRQGMQAFTRLDADLAAGGDPFGPVADRALVVVAGILLILPGFLSDAVALLLLVPPVRRALLRRGAASVTVRATTVYVRPRGPSRPQPEASKTPPETIEADYEVVRDAKPRSGPSGWTQP